MFKKLFSLIFVSQRNVVFCTFLNGNRNQLVLRIGATGMSTIRIEKPRKRTYLNKLAVFFRIDVTTALHKTELFICTARTRSDMITNSFYHLRQTKLVLFPNVYVLNITLLTQSVGFIIQGEVIGFLETLPLHLLQIRKV